MSKDDSSKIDPEVARPSPQGDGEDVETARLAYSYWEARGGTSGSAEEDWERAEQELKALRL